VLVSNRCNLIAGCTSPTSIYRLPLAFCGAKSLALEGNPAQSVTCRRFESAGKIFSNNFAKRVDRVCVS
jgi:hypothetical protein